MKGFTFLELILVIAILLILGTISIPFAGSYLIKNNQQIAVDRVMSEIWKAQDFAMSGRQINGSKVWGVCVTGSVFRLFNGSCASPVLKEDYVFPVGVSVSGIESVTFDSLTGAPSAVSTIVVSNDLKGSIITINAAGMTTEQ